MTTTLVLVLYSLVNFGVCNDPQREPPPSIVDGKIFDDKQNSYHLSLKHKKNHICSAALLKTEYDKVVAITAATCLSSQKPGEYSLSFGKIVDDEDLVKFEDEYCILTKIRLFEDFDKKTLNNDLALLLSDDIKKTGRCDVLINKGLGLILANSTTSKSHLKISGWDDTTDTLKAIEDAVITNPDVCNDQVLEEENVTIGPTMLCHGVPMDKRDLGRCRAERGSPVVAYKPGSPLVLVAVTSWTWITEFMEDTFYPCVATAVFDDTIKRWIEYEVKEFAKQY